MAKFCGVIGYAVTSDTVPGVWIPEITERRHFGDVLQFHTRWKNGEYLNDDLDVNNKISIVADPFAYEHFHSMKYVEWMGAKWKVTNVEVLYPRLILTIGGVYNEEQA